MRGTDIVILLVVAVCVVLAFRSICRQRKRGCCGNCSGCAAVCPFAGRVTYKEKTSR